MQAKVSCMGGELCRRKLNNRLFHIRNALRLAIGKLWQIIAMNLPESLDGLVKPLNKGGESFYT